MDFSQPITMADANEDSLPAESEAGAAESEAGAAEDGLPGNGSEANGLEEDIDVARRKVNSLPVAGLGVDIIEIDRMQKAITRTPRMLERVFSETERSYAQERARPAVHYALFFAAKEAVLKALGTGFSGMAFTDVEVDHDRYGRPIPILHGQARALAEKQGIIEMQLSLSYTHAVGVASAVAIKEQDRPRRDEKVDPRVELARQFREVRAILDEMDGQLGDLEEEGALSEEEKGARAKNNRTENASGAVHPDQQFHDLVPGQAWDDI